jgi:hypothetical protein
MYLKLIGKTANTMTRKSKYFQIVLDDAATDICRCAWMQPCPSVESGRHSTLRTAQRLCNWHIYGGTFYLRRPIHSKLNSAIITVGLYTWQTNWVNCAVLTGNSAGLRTVLSSRLSHTELRTSIRESHSFLSSTAHSIVASSQGT